MQVAHEHKVPLIVDNTFGMGGMRAQAVLVSVESHLIGAYVRVSNPSH
jgi:O-acetylhomoserine/O-acetylserine sulfhydrylase-like pyridoxal-dependent enzyme